MSIWPRLAIRTAGLIRSPIVYSRVNSKLSKLLPYSSRSVGTSIGVKSSKKDSDKTPVNWSHQRNMEGRTPEGVLPSTRDRFRGNTVDTNLTTIDAAKFPEQLKKSLDWWAEQGSRAIWFKVNLKHSFLVPILTENSFNFHHAKDGFVMMVRWIHTQETANVPPFAHTMVGVGGIVINAKDQILSVTEKQSIIPGSWKLPGGYVDPGEYLVEAVIREVFEETGIRTRFESLVNIRHSHNANFNCSDLYIVMSLRTIGDEAGADAISACPREIAAAQWMEFDEFLNHPNVHEINRELLQQYLKNRQAGVLMTCKERTHALLRRKYNIFSLDFPGDAKL